MSGLSILLRCEMKTRVADMNGSNHAGVIIDHGQYQLASLQAKSV